MAVPDARFRLAATLIAVGSLLGLGCGTARPEPGAAGSLLSGSRAPVPPTRLDRGSAAARHFAYTYARSIYREHPPALPGATDRVISTLRAAAARVPPPRRGLTPRAAGLRLALISPAVISARVTIVDGRSPPFTVGFGLQRRGRHWLITSISPPG